MAREILPLLRVGGVDSPQESRLRLKIVDAGCRSQRSRSPSSMNKAGTYPRRTSNTRNTKLPWSMRGIIIDPTVQWGKDIERDDRLRALGWIVLKFSDVQMKGGWANAERKVRDALASRGWRGPAS